MPRYVALLRGINIGAHKRIAMADLRALAEALGHTDVRTYVNSGNLVFTADGQDDRTLAGEIEAAIMDRFGLTVPVVVRSGAEMAEVVAGNPWPEHATNHKTLHVVFLADVPAADHVTTLAAAERGEDDYRVIGKHVYLHYPNGIAGAVFMSNGLDRALVATATSRNWRTVLKLAEMTRDPR